MLQHLEAISPGREIDPDFTPTDLTENRFRLERAAVREFDNGNAKVACHLCTA